MKVTRRRRPEFGRGASPLRSGETVDHPPPIHSRSCGRGCLAGRRDEGTLTVGGVRARGRSFENDERTQAQAHQNGPNILQAKDLQNPDS